MSKRLLVTGGDGFIGRHVCRIAAAQGHEVISVARSGRGDVEGDWARNVNWVAANVLQPETWREHLEGVAAVIHCVGILREQKKAGETYERINDEAAELVAWEAEHAGVPKFVFLSAGTPRAIVPDRFVDSKRWAEQKLQRSEIRESVLRPAFVYGSDRPATVAGARILQAAERVPGLHDIFHATRPLRVEQVALASIRAATEEGYEGTISIDNIEYLAGDDWQQYEEPRSERQTSSRSDRAPALIIGGAVAGAIAGVAWKLIGRRR